MKILFTVEFFHPHVGGAQEVVRQIATGLASRGHQVTVATSKIKGRKQNILDGVRIDEFAVTGNEVRGMSGEIKRYQKYLLANDCDVMVNYAAQQWATDLVYPIIDLIQYKKILIPCGFSGLYSPRYHTYFANMRDILGKYNHLIFHSQNYRDINFAREHGISHFSVIPNGASIKEFSGDRKWFRDKYNIKEGTPILLSVGNHTGMKGHEFLINVFSQLGLADVVLVIIGKGVDQIGCLPKCKLSALTTNIFSKHRRRILMIDPPRDEVVQAYYAADLYLMASKVECAPLVLIEAMASKTPFISLAVGNAEELVNQFGCGVIAPTHTDEMGYSYGDMSSFVMHIRDLLYDSRRRQLMAENGYQAWINNLTWEAIIGLYEQVIEKVIKNEH